jgi:hypothetical protein
VIKRYCDELAGLGAGAGGFGVVVDDGGECRWGLRRLGAGMGLVWTVGKGLYMP